MAGEDAEASVLGDRRRGRRRRSGAKGGEPIGVLAAGGVGHSGDEAAERRAPLTVAERGAARGFVFGDEGQRLLDRGDALVSPDTPVGGEGVGRRAGEDRLWPNGEAVPVIDGAQRAVDEAQVLDAPIAVTDDRLAGDMLVQSPPSGRSG